MLSIFPYLLSWNQLAPFIIRITLGAVLIYWTYSHKDFISMPAEQKMLTIVEGISGILLIIGMWTQVAALVVALDLIYRLLGKIKKNAFFTDGINYYFILLILAISLLFTGAGFMSVDLPL